MNQEGATRLGESFVLAVSLERDVFRRGEPIAVSLRFDNVGKTVIEMDGILPLREDAAPPCLEVDGDDGRQIRVEHGVSRGLMTTDPLVVQPGRSMLLMYVDLLDAPGWVRSLKERQNGEPGRSFDRLASCLIPGDYSIRGNFQPTPGRYRSTTEWVPFTIR